jgi:peptidoglycan-N-acetylglucosamine deacetylase
VVTSEFPDRRSLARNAARAVALALLLQACAGTARPEPAPAARRAVAVTFDDLPVISVTQLDAEARRDVTQHLLASLARQGVPAIGFVNEYGLHGFAREPGPEPDPNGVALLGLWLDAGDELGNHGFAHADLHATTLAGYTRDIVLGEAVSAPLVQARGRQLRYFRHPYLHTGRDLATKQDVERFLAARGYRVAPVTVDNEDYLFAAAYSRAAERGDAAFMARVATEYVAYTERAFEYSERLAQAVFGREIRHVLLLHANALNAEHFDDLARMMRARGYGFLSLDEALLDPAYASSDRYVGPESINWLGRWAITSGLRTDENVLDDFPDVPEFVAQAAEG